MIRTTPRLFWQRLALFFEPVYLAAAVALVLRYPKLVLQAFPEACLLLGGPGDPCHDELSKLPHGSFRDIGLASERTKADALAACDVFCLPSSHESFGIAYVEAWSYGKPVICGTAPACRELVDNGKSGLWADQTRRISRRRS